jgi:hypothetical protein
MSNAIEAVLSWQFVIIYRDVVARVFLLESHRLFLDMHLITTISKNWNSSAMLKMPCTVEAQ